MYALREFANGVGWYPLLSSVIEPPLQADVLRGLSIANVGLIRSYGFAGRGLSTSRRS